MAFAKGDAGEDIVRTDIGEILSEVKSQAHGGKDDRASRSKSAPLVVPVRRHAFKRAVTNLVNNAARFAEHVNVSADKQNGALTVEVEDDGPGIPEAERENVFRPFYRLDHARNQDAGSTGLGLAIARDIARIHGGDIALEPIPARRIEGRAKSSGLICDKNHWEETFSCVEWLWHCGGDGRVLRGARVRRRHDGRDARGGAAGLRDRAGYWRRRRHVSSARVARRCFSLATCR